MTSQPDHTIVISPIGDLDVGLINPIAIEVNRIFGFQTEIMPLIDNIDFAHNPERDQYNSTQVLEKLDGLAPPRTLKVLAVTEVDLFIPILTYVYGEAQLGGKACIISTHRLRMSLPSVVYGETFKSRIVKEAVHELGHTFNLRHCKDSECIMHYCRSTQDVDLKSENLCRYCRVMTDDEIKRLGME